MACAKKAKTTGMFEETRQADRVDAKTKALGESLKDHLADAKGIVKMLDGAIAANKAGHDECTQFLSCAADQAAQLTGSARATVRRWPATKVAAPSASTGTDS